MTSVPKRLARMGIRQRSDGRWYAVVDRGTRNGKRQREYLYGRTPKEVETKLDTARTAANAGLAAPPQRLTVGAHLEHWLEAVIQPHRREKTYSGYAVCVRRHIVPGLGHLRLVRLTPQDVERWIRAELALGLSPRTVQYAHAVLRAGLEHALRQGLLLRNVAKLVEGVRVERPAVEPLEPEQVRALLDAVRGDRLEALYVLAVYTGLRRGELLGLRWSDLDLKRAEVRVHSQAQGGRAGEPLKRGAGRRTIPLAPAAVAALHEHRIRQLETQLKAAQRWQDNDLVFASERGTTINPSNLWRHTADLLERAGIEHHRMHLYRHTFASLHLAEGAELHEVSRLLGHSGIQITSDVYGHLTRQARREAADRIQRAIARQSGS